MQNAVYVALILFMLVVSGLLSVMAYAVWKSL